MGRDARDVFFFHSQWLESISLPALQMSIIDSVHLSDRNLPQCVLLRSRSNYFNKPNPRSRSG